MPIIGSAADESVADRAADATQQAGTFAGWVNNAAAFRDGAIHVAPAGEVLDLIEANLAPALVGSATALRRCSPPGRRPRGIRANAVALGSIDTERHRAFLAGQAPSEAERIAERMAHFRHSTDPTDGMNWCSVHRPAKNRTETGLYGT